VTVDLQPRLWPAQCCVPAFIHAALVHFGITNLVPEALPSILGVRVRPDQENPLGLALANDAYPPGISGADAEREVNRVCRDLGLPIRLRRVPLNSIAFDLWEDVLVAALESGAAVGVGLDYHVLTGADSLRSAQHVLRVVSLREDTFELFDDSGEMVPPHSYVGGDRLHRAIVAIPDGLWIVGRKRDLALPLTLPWSDCP
jgi:hypothetical protein